MNVPSVLVEKQTHTPLSFAMLTTCALADESSTPGKNACLIIGQNDVCDFPVDAACIKCSRPLPANDSVMGASLNVLSMLCGSNIVARGAAPALCKSALPGVRVGQRVSPLAVLLTENQHEQQQASPQLLVAEFQFER